MYKMIEGNELLKAYHAGVAAGLTVGSFSCACQRPINRSLILEKE
jgi:hypothetical protein